MAQEERPTSHTSMMVAWDKLPLPVAEIAKNIAPDAKDALEREVHLATTMLCFGLAVALARCRQRGLVPPADIFGFYEEESPGGLARAIHLLDEQYPDAVGWVPSTPYPGAAAMQKLLDMQRGPPTVGTALEAIRLIRNKWAHGKNLPASRPACAAALDAMLPGLATSNPDFHLRLLRIDTREQRAGEPERVRAHVMAGAAPVPYKRHAEVELPAPVQAGHVVLLDEKNGTLLDLYPFVVGDETGLWVLWTVDRDRAVLRRGAWVITNGPPPKTTGDLDWLTKERRTDLDALRAILGKWRASDVTSVDSSPPIEAAPTVASVADAPHANQEPQPIAAGLGIASPRRRGHNRLLSWVAGGLVLGSLSIAAVMSSAGSSPPTRDELPSVLTGLPLRWGDTTAAADRASGPFPPTDVDACVRDVIEIRGLVGVAQPPIDAVAAGGMTFHSDEGLYEITFRSNATYGDLRSALVELLGEPTSTEAQAAVWEIQDARVRLAVRGAQVALHAWLPAIDDLYTAARRERCGRE